MNLLEQYLALTDDTARAEFLARLSADDLTELNTLAEAAFAAAEAEAPSDANLATLTQVADTLEVIAGEATRREGEATRIEAERQAQIDRVRGQSDTGTDGDGEDGDAGDGDAGAGDGADGEGADGGDAGAGDGDQGDGEGADGDGTGDAGTDAMAAATLPRARPRIQATARPAGQMTQGSGRTTSRDVVPLVAAAGLPVQAGSVLVAPGQTDLSDLAAAAEATFNNLAGGKGRRQAIVASARATYPEHRVLDLNASQNTERINRAMREVQSPDPIVAAGGFCAPGTQRYELPTVGDTGRPVRDTALVNYMATRGRVRWMPSPQLADVDSGAVSLWTNQNDIDAVSGSPTKPCLRIECPDDLDAETYAIVRCLEFGNFNARTFPEQIDAITNLVGVWHDRYAEQRLLTLIDGLSTAVTHGQVLGTTSDALAALDQLMEGIRSRYRIMTTRLRVILPEFFRAMIRVDISRQIPGGGTLDERYAVADEMIARWFDRRGANVTWTLDSQVFGSQGVGSLIGWPSTVVARVYVEGTFSFLDGGELNLGMVRDSVLNSTNDFQMFAETFEGVAKFGPTQAFTLTMDVCSDGSTSGTVDINPCVSGS